MAQPALDSGVTKTEGEQDMTSLLRCGSVDILTADQRRSAAWMIGASLGLTLVYFGLLTVFGRHMMVQALLYAAVPIAHTVSARSTYLKPYSRIARNGIVIAGVLGWYAFFLAVTALSALI
jgi:hypothetical protein